MTARNSQERVAELHDLFRRVGDLIEELREGGGVTTHLTVYHNEGSESTMHHDLNGEFNVRCFKQHEISVGQDQHDVVQSFIATGREVRRAEPMPLHEAELFANGALQVVDQETFSVDILPHEDPEYEPPGEPL